MGCSQSGLGIVKLKPINPDNKAGVAWLLGIASGSLSVLGLPMWLFLLLAVLLLAAFMVCMAWPTSHATIRNVKVNYMTNEQLQFHYMLLQRFPKLKCKTCGGNGDHMEPGREVYGVEGAGDVATGPCLDCDGTGLAHV